MGVIWKASNQMAEAETKVILLKSLGRYRAKSTVQVLIQLLFIELLEGTKVEPSILPNRTLKFSFPKADLKAVMGDFPGGPVVRIRLPVQGTQVQSLGWKAPLKKEMTTYSSILAWKIPWTEESGGLHRVTKSQT